jgi:hypothetical protein
MSNILIKYSTVNETPISLYKGELAYSQLSGKLFIGDNMGVPQLIGGADLVARFGVAEGEITQLKLDVDAAEGEIQTLINSVLGAGGVVERLGALEGVRDDHDGRITTNLSRINGIDDAYKAADAALTGEIARVEGAITALQTQVGTGLSGRVDTLETSQGLQDGLLRDIDANLTGVVNLLNSGDPTFGNLTVTGKLIVNGGVTSIESTVVTIKDPVISLGDATTAANDGMDRGVEFKHFDAASNSIKTGFFGMDASDNKFKFIPDALMNSGDNVYEGLTGVIVADVEGSALKLAAEVKIELSGEASGSVMFDGSKDVTIAVAVAGSSEAYAEQLVRRDAAGNAKFAVIETSGISLFKGGADFNGRELLNAFIDGGTF